MVVRMGRRGPVWADRDPPQPPPSPSTLHLCEQHATICSTTEQFARLRNVRGEAAPSGSSPRLRLQSPAPKGYPAGSFRPRWGGTVGLKPSATATKPACAGSFRPRRWPSYT